jgi:CRP-like cAMP-binding protein
MLEQHAQGGTLEATGVQLRRLATGERLFDQGDPGDSVYIVASGQLEVKVHVPEQEDRTLCMLKRNAIVGEMSLLLDEPRSATAEARSPSVVWQIPRGEFQAAIHRGDHWTNSLLLLMLQMLARRLADMNGELVSLIAAQHNTNAGDEASTVNVAELERLRQRLLSQ